MRHEPASQKTPTTQRKRPSPWFRVKSTGGGFIPCAWQGWVLIATMPFALLATQAIAGSGWVIVARYAAGAALAAIYLLVISLTGGRTVWNWVIRSGG